MGLDTDPGLGLVGWSILASPTWCFLYGLGQISPSTSEPPLLCVSTSQIHAYVETHLQYLSYSRHFFLEALFDVPRQSVPSPLATSSHHLLFPCLPLHTVTT